MFLASFNLFSALKQFHRLADTNRDGKISGFEMLKFTRDNFGKYLNMLKVGRAFQSADANRNGKLSLTGIVLFYSGKRGLLALRMISILQKVKQPAAGFLSILGEQCRKRILGRNIWKFLRQ